MSSIYVTFWFDVEDYITPESDDALKSLIEIFDRQNAKGTFKLVGEKLRVLEERGRTDIIDLLRNHDIGYHTDFHSRHPTPAEYLKELNWDDGVAEFKRIEGPGYEDIKRIFSITPSCYGQPGSSWGPQSYQAICNWGIPAYVDECYQVGLDQQPFWYCGTFNILKMRSNCTRMRLRGGDEVVAEAKRNFDRIVERLRPTGGTISIYYHPCEFSTMQFWDGVNFAKGVNTPRGNWKLPELKPQSMARRDLRNFEQYLGYIKSVPGVEIVTIPELLKHYPDHASQREFTIDELAELVYSPEDCITYKKMKDFAVSPIEIFRMMMITLSEYALSNRLPETIRNDASKIIGPTKRIESTPDLVLPIRSILGACIEANKFMSERSRMPNSVQIGNKQIAPPDLFVTASSLFRSIYTSCEKSFVTPEILESLPISSGMLTLEENVTGEGVWGWVIFPDGFDAPELIELGKLQTWTLKPAIFAKKIAYEI